MNNVECMLSTREQTRIGHSATFLKDMIVQGAHHFHNPRNFIGFKCGISFGRAYDIADRRNYNAQKQT